VKSGVTAFKLWDFWGSFTKVVLGSVS